jgi:glycosyltransferase involved in cell wall biosynthesis
MERGRGGRVSRLLTWERRDPDAEVLVVTSGWPTPENARYCVFIQRQVDSVRAEGVAVDVLFVHGYRSPLAYAAAAARLLVLGLSGRGRYRIVHAQIGEAAVVAALYTRAPLVISFCGDDLLGTRRLDGSITLQSRIRRQVHRLAALRAGRTITKGRHMEPHLPRRVRPRNRVIPNGVDMDQFQPGDRADARRELGWDLDAAVALVVGSDVPVKRLPLARQAAEIARRTIPDLRLVEAADVPPEDVPTLMRAADCLLLTSSSEGSPNVVKEALMCNLPVVTTRVGDVEALLAGVEPSFVSGDAPAQLAAALVECLGDRRRSNGRAQSRHLSLEAVAQRVVHVYSELGLRSEA